MQMIIPGSLQDSSLVQASSIEDDQGKHEKHRSFVSRLLQCFLSTIFFYFRWSDVLQAQTFPRAWVMADKRMMTENLNIYLHASLVYEYVFKAIFVQDKSKQALEFGFHYICRSWCLRGETQKPIFLKEIVQLNWNFLRGMDTITVGTKCWSQGTGHCS